MIANRRHGRAAVLLSLACVVTLLVVVQFLYSTRSLEDHNKRLEEVYLRLEELSFRPSKSTLAAAAVAATTKLAVTTTDLFPSCTEEDRTIILTQLPKEECYEYAGRPWFIRCSFSYATQCPEALWLSEYYSRLHRDNNDSRQPQQSQLSRRKMTAIYVGCNKAMDAVNTLRMLSNDPSFDLPTWQRELSAQSNNATIKPGVCAQESQSQFEVQMLGGGGSSAATTGGGTDVVVHCIEAMPVTADALRRATQSLGWDGVLVVENVAMGAANGMVAFPNENHPKVKGAVGTENAGAGECGEDATWCTDIPLETLDSYVGRTMAPFEKTNGTGGGSNVDDEGITMIDFLSIDVEGLDADVLKGSRDTLAHRVRYLEFEYNWMGEWNRHSLADIIQRDLLPLGFVCYWPGVGGNLWRMSGESCFLPHYDDVKVWSNVACVNRHHAPAGLVTTMEGMFRTTLASNDSIRYGDKTTARTDGKTWTHKQQY